ncbi:MAG: hypothetical protein ACRDCW_00135 [Sarcina sp.]
MPDFHRYEEVPLDDAIQYYKNYYKRSKNTSDMKWYVFSLENFIDPRFNDEYIKTLNKQTFKVIAARNSSTNYRLRIDYTDDTPTILTYQQIQDLQNFNDYLKTPNVKKTLATGEKFAKILWGSIFSFLLILYIIHVINYIK